MKKNILYTFALGCLSLSLSSCGAYLSAGGGYGSPVSVYDDGYNVGYSSTYGRIGYEEARRQALFLSDKMAYELGLSDAQYQAVYEINLDYLLNMQGERSLYGDYWARRNSDLFYVLNARQYNYYIGEDYFYRPVYWYNNDYAYRVYNRYRDRNYYYRSRPAEYYTYRGGRNRYNDSYYAGRFGARRNPPTVTNRTRTSQEVYQNGGSWNTPQQNNGYSSFGNARRENMNTAPSRSYNEQFGGARPQSERQTYQPQQQQYSTPPQPSGSRSSFGSASRSSAPSAPMNSNQPSFGGASRSSAPSVPMNSNQSSFGNASRSSVPSAPMNSNQSSWVQPVQMHQRIIVDSVDIDSRKKYMRITEINRSRVASVMVRGYFHAFFSGLADALYPGKKRLEPKEYKQLLVNNFDNLSGHFVSVLFPVLIRLNYSDLETVAEDMKRRHFSETTSAKILLRYACGSKELYDLVTAEYQKQMFALLDGHLQSAEDYFADCPT